MAGLPRPFAILISTCAFCLGVTGTASAQYRIDAWTIENGLPQNVITEIAQTRDGFLWLATFGGLVRFDGANMHVFTTVNAPGMRSSRLTGGLLETSDGALWINTEGHGVVRYVSGTFSTYDAADGLPDTRVRLLLLEDGRLVVDTPKGMCRWDGTRFVPHKSARPAGDDPQKVVVSPTGTPVWYHDAAGIHRLENGRVTRTVPGLNPRRLFEDHTGRIWMETQDRHLQTVTPAGVTTTYGPEVPPTVSRPTTATRSSRTAVATS